MLSKRKQARKTAPKRKPAVPHTTHTYSTGTMTLSHPPTLHTNTSHTHQPYISPLLHTQTQTRAAGQQSSAGSAPCHQASVQTLKLQRVQGIYRAGEAVLKRPSVPPRNPEGPAHTNTHTYANTHIHRYAHTHTHKHIPRRQG